MTYSDILLIDDDEDDQEIFQSVLASVSQAVKCTAVSDAELALEKLQTKELKPDLIFLDLNMPAMTGQQFLKMLKVEDGIKDIPVIILTTSSRLETMQEVKRLGAAGFHTKPNRFSDLRKILGALLL